MSYDKTVTILVCTGGAWELVNGVLEYRPLGLMRRTIEVGVNSRYSDLKHVVAKKLKLSQKSGFTMSYQVPCSSSTQSTTVVVEICDNEDVGIFMGIAPKEKDKMIALYVVEPASSGLDPSFFI